MSNSESIILGVVSGIITSVFIYFSLSIIKRIILPWYQTLIYRGTIISGEWHCKGINHGQDAHFNIVQKANILSGIATFIDIDPTSKFDPIRSFKISGEIQDRFVTFSLKHTDAKRLGASVFLIQVVGDGTELSGAKCSYKINSSKIFPAETTLTRNNDIPVKDKTPNRLIEKQFRNN